MPDRCQVTELQVEQCSHCRPAPEPTPRRAPGPTIAARYEGRCAGCRDWFPEGTSITADPDGHGWLADCCAEGDEDA